MGILSPFIYFSSQLIESGIVNIGKCGCNQLVINKNNKLTDLQTLLERLKSNSSNNRFDAVIQLGKSSFQETNDILKQLIISDPETIIRELALITLTEKIKPEVLDIAKKIFYNPSEQPIMRARATWVFSQIQSKQAFDLAKEALNDRNEEVVYWALIGIMTFENASDAIPEIRKLAVKSRHSIIRQTAVWTIGMLGDIESRELLEDRMLIDTVPIVRLLSTWALRKIDCLESIPNLSNALSKDTNKLTRREIASTIGKILDFEKQYESSQEQQSLFREMQDIAARVLIRALLGDTSYVVRRTCAESLGKIRYKGILEKLIEALTTETNLFVRKEIVNTLGTISDPKALDILKKAIRSHYKTIVEAAKEAIKKIKKSNE